VVTVCTLISHYVVERHHNAKGAGR
jgi:hypothetical protein